VGPKAVLDLARRSSGGSAARRTHEGLFKDSYTRAAGATARVRGQRADMRTWGRDPATFVALRMTPKACVGSVAIRRVRESVDPARLARVQRDNPQIATCYILLTRSQWPPCGVPTVFSWPDTLIRQDRRSYPLLIVPDNDTGRRVTRTQPTVMAAGSQPLQTTTYLPWRSVVGGVHI
jgi:hypothetical protein